MRVESSTKPRQRSARPGIAIVVVALAALAAGTAATSGLWTDLSGRFVEANVPDGIHYSWWLGHTPHALGLGENPFRTLDLNWSEGVSAMNNTTLLLPAVLLWPVTALFGSLVSLNVLNTLAVPVCAAAGYWALRQVPLTGLRDSDSDSDSDSAEAGSKLGAEDEAISAPSPASAPTSAARDGVKNAGSVEGQGSSEPGAAAPGSSEGQNSSGAQGDSEGRIAATEQAEIQRIGRPAALVGAVAFAISPAIVNSLVGHITMAFAPGLALLVGLSVLAWYGDRPVRTGALLGVAATAQVFTGEEVLFQAVVGAALVLLVAAISRPQAIAAGAGRLAKSLLVAFAVFLPITAYPLYLQFFGPLKQEGSPFLLDFFGADVTAFTTPTSQLWLHSEEQAARSVKFAGGIEEHLAYLGWPLVIICLLTMVVGWRWVAVRCAAVALLVAAALSLGGRLWINGTWTEHAGPYKIFQSLPVTEASLATRFGLLAALFAGALLAFAVHLISTQAQVQRSAYGVVLATAVSVVCLAPLVPVPLKVVDAAPIPTWFSSTAKELPAESVVVVLPYPVPTQPVAMRWQSAADYRFRMPGGYFLGPASDGHAYVGGSADPPTANLLNEVATTGQPVAVTPEQQAQALVDLRAWGADQIVLGPDPAQAALQQTMTALIGREPQSVDGVLLWANPVTS